MSRLYYRRWPKNSPAPASVSLIVMQCALSRAAEKNDAIPPSGYYNVGAVAQRCWSNRHYLGFGDLYEA